MFLYNLKRKLRRLRIDSHLQESGYSYHHHCWEIVVSENELLIQLQECDIHTNLLNLLIYANSRCFECADLSEQLGSAFNLGELPLNFKADNSTHYTEGVFGKYRYEPTTERSKHEHHKKIKRNNF